MSLYEFGPYRLDAERLLLLHAGEPLPLGPKVVATLLALVEHPGDVVGKSELLDRIWPEGYVEEANLTQNVYVLRKTLRAQWAADPIVTVPRRGYRFDAQVVRLANPLPAEPAVVRVAPAAEVSPARTSPFRMGFAVFATLAATIALAVLPGAALVPVTHVSPPLSMQGQRNFAIGRYYWNQRTQAGVEKSMAYFERVTASDPHDARGYAALAQADAIMGQYRFGKIPAGTYTKRASTYANQALSIDPRSADAYAALGLIDIGSDDYPRAERELHTATTLDPHNASAHQWYGTILLSHGDVEGGLTEIQMAANLDPLSVPATFWLSNAAYFARRYDDAIAYARQTLDLSPRFRKVWVTLGESMEGRGDYRQAVAAFTAYAQHCQQCRGEAAALLAYAYAKMGQQALARDQLRVAEKSGKVMPSDIALAYAAVGDHTSAVRWLHRLRDPDERAFIAIDPRLDGFRHDREFRDLVRHPA